MEEGAHRVCRFTADFDVGQAAQQLAERCGELLPRQLVTEAAWWMPPPPKLTCGLGSRERSNRSGWLLRLPMRSAATARNWGVVAHQLGVAPPARIAGFVGDLATHILGHTHHVADAVRRQQR